MFNKNVKPPNRRESLKRSKLKDFPKPSYNIEFFLVKSLKNVENFIRFYETLKRSFPNNPGLSLEILSNPNLSSIFLV